MQVIAANQLGHFLYLPRSLSKFKLIHYRRSLILSTHSALFMQGAHISPPESRWQRLRIRTRAHLASKTKAQTWPRPARLK